MTDLPSALGEQAAAAFASLGLRADLGRVTPSDRPDLADFQVNGALAAAKAARRNPRDIAADVAAALRQRAPEIDSIAIAGPGFINMRLTNVALSARAQSLADDPRAGAGRIEPPRRVLVDYAGPNVAKEMHVGHLRASIIGEAIKRLHRFLGEETLGDAHFGDWGFQMGLLIVAASEARPELAAFIDRVGLAVGEPTADEAESAQGAPLDLIRLEDLDALYPPAAARAKSDPTFRDRVRKATADLQAGRTAYRLLWAHFARLSRTALERDFHALGIDFDVWKGESDVEALIGPMIADLDRKGLLEDDQGARIVRVARQGDRREIPPLLVVSSEGSAMYGTTDLATIIDRRNYFHPDLVLYVVDQRQADHFETVFRAAYLAGYAAEGSLQHIGFGTMNGPDGKPFKTRAGGVLKLRDLIDMATEKARERLRAAGIGGELAADEFEDIAAKVAVAAVKFADLANFRGAAYVFDLERFSSFEGKTGPYLLYQAVRIKSLLRRAAAEGVGAGPIAIAADAERDLVLVLDAFDRTLREACEKSAPHLAAEHAWRIAQAFSKFYADCPILTAEPTVAASRLALATLVLRQMELTLEVLGITTPERM